MFHGNLIESISALQLVGSFKLLCFIVILFAILFFFLHFLICNKRSAWCSSISSFFLVFFRIWTQWNATAPLRFFFFVNCLFIVLLAQILRWIAQFDGFYSHIVQSLLEIDIPEYFASFPFTCVGKWNRNEKKKDRKNEQKLLFSCFIPFKKAFSLEIKPFEWNEGETNWILYIFFSVWIIDAHTHEMKMVFFPCLIFIASVT